jgi:hypothetical protein
MNFKERIAADLETIFLLGDEFAELHTVEGEKILCILDTDREERDSDGAMYDLAAADLVLMANTKDLPPRKAAGNLLNLDGKELTVVTWDEQDGLTIVGLALNVTA